MAAWIGLRKDGEDDCDKDDIDCRREGWKWEDLTHYDFDKYHEWKECGEEKERISSCQQTQQPEHGMQCAIIFEGNWFGVKCEGNESKYLCFCEARQEVLRKSFHSTSFVVDEIQRTREVMSKYIILYKERHSNKIIKCFPMC